MVSDDLRRSIEIVIGHGADSLLESAGGLVRQCVGER